ncbi:MAG: hypothetical protein MSS60_00195 [Clostridiales bacterium]|nr:hypothetical protein [Clostridiales bacterium]
MTVYEKIAAQQKGHENTDIWMVGQQLKDILRGDPTLEEMVDKDMDVEDMSLANAAKKIKAWADEQHKKTKGSCVCVPPDVAEGIIREFYGLPACGSSEPASAPVVEDDALPDFADFL